MEFVERSGRTVDEAVTEALIQLGTTRDQVDIEIIEEGSKGFLGIFGSKIARVRVTKKFNPVDGAIEFLEKVFDKMNLVVKIDAEMVENRQLNIELSGDNMGILIGKRGQTLDSLQYLISLVVNKGEEGYIRVKLDTENYRERRKETLEGLAHNLAKKAKNTRRKVVLEPMNPYERRIIHAALQGNRYVKTHSEGDEPHRKVVISPVLKERSHSKTQ